MCHYFDYYSKKHLNEYSKLIKIGNQLALKNKPICIKTPYLYIVFRPYKKVYKVIPIYDSNNKLRMRLKIHNYLIKNQLIIDNQDQKKTFAPNCIHSMDATINIHYCKTVQLVNNRLKNHNLILTMGVNHDNFYLSALSLIHPFVKDSYLYLYDLNYLSLIEGEDLSDFIEKSNSSNYLNKDFNNPNFIKTG